MKQFTVTAIMMMLVSCNHRYEPAPDHKAATTELNDTITKQYFPVQDFLLSEISYVDSLPVGIMKYTTNNGKVDSGYIKSNEFHELAGEFISPELEENQFRRSFKEISFFDHSTESSTFTYSPIQESTDIKRIDVISRESRGYDRINSIYIEKETGKPGARRLKKLFWKAGKNFQIISPASANGQNETVIKVVWNYWD